MVCIITVDVTEDGISDVNSNEEYKPSCNYILECFMVFFFWTSNAFTHNIFMKCVSVSKTLANNYDIMIFIIWNEPKYQNQYFYYRPNNIFGLTEVTLGEEEFGEEETENQRMKKRRRGPRVLWLQWLKMKTFIFIISNRRRVLHRVHEVSVEIGQN